MYCHLCAGRVEDEEVFCRKCGTELVAIKPVDPKVSVVKSAGHFLFGSGLFLAAFLVLIAILSLFLNGSPQLTMLLLVILGTAMSGFYMLLLKRKENNFRHRSHKPSQPNEIVMPELHQLPDRQFSSVPESVTDSTTTKLRR